jgi:hypothetical protein
MTYSGFGNGGDGIATLSGTDAPIDSSCSGTSGTKTLTATNASFAANKIVLIHQTQGTGAGNWELNIIDSYVAGTITTLFNLVNTYATGAQVIQIKEYSSVTVSGTLIAKLWTGTVGGIIAFFCNGQTTISGTVTADARGFLGASVHGFDDGWAGEGTTGASLKQTTANGNGGGGSGSAFYGGGGGGNSASGTTGSGSNPGIGGNSSGTATLSTMTFGGGGGSSTDASGGGGQGNGGRGGGIIFIFSSELTVTGSITASGAVGSNGNPARQDGGGGGGAGGSIYIRAISCSLGASLITALGASGGTGTNGGSNGGAGSTGRIRIEACSRSGSTNPGASESIGGQDFCQSFISIY